MHLKFWIMSLNKNEKITYPIIAIISIVIVICWVNLTFGSTREVTGNIIRVGIDSSSYFKLSRIVATVLIRNDDIAIVKLPAGTNIEVGGNLILLERDMLFTSGRSYSYARKEK